jgi:hypothetical protein
MKNTYCSSIQPLRGCSFYLILFSAFHAELLLFNPFRIANHCFFIRLNSLPRRGKTIIAVGETYGKITNAMLRTPKGFNNKTYEINICDFKLV